MILSLKTLKFVNPFLWKKIRTSIVNSLNNHIRDHCNHALCIGLIHYTHCVLSDIFFIEICRTTFYTSSCMYLKLEVTSKHLTPLRIHVALIAMLFTYGIFFFSPNPFPPPYFFSSCSSFLSPLSVTSSLLGTILESVSDP